MKTTYVIQKCHPNMGAEWRIREWHDRGDSRPHTDVSTAVTECRQLIMGADAVKYRIVKRTDEVISLENAESSHGRDKT